MLTSTSTVAARPALQHCQRSVLVTGRRDRVTPRQQHYALRTEVINEPPWNIPGTEPWWFHRHNNPNNLLQDLALANGSPPPTYEPSPSCSVNRKQFQVKLEHNQVELVATGKVYKTKKHAQMSAAAALLAHFAKENNEATAHVHFAPNYDIGVDVDDVFSRRPDFVGCLQSLCERQGWQLPVYSNVLLPLSEDNSGERTTYDWTTPEEETELQVHVTCASGEDRFWARSANIFVKHAKQVPAARMLLCLVDKGKMLPSELPVVLQEHPVAQQAARSVA